jgi:hypothetical protein
MDFSGTFSSVSKALGMSPKRDSTADTEQKISQAQNSTHGYNTRSRPVVNPSQDEPTAPTEKDSMISIILSMKASIENFQASVQNEFQAMKARLNVLEEKRSSRQSSRSSCQSKESEERKG